VIAAAVDDLSDVLVHRQSRVQCDTKQLDSVTERHYCPCDINAASHLYLVALDLSAKQNRFHLGRVETQPVEATRFLGTSERRLRQTTTLT